MTVDRFAYHYHHPHHHPHQLPSPVTTAPTGNFPFSSFFHFPSSFALLFFHLGELGQPNHVQFRVTVTVMTVIFYFSCIFPVVVQGSGKTKKASRAEKKKVKFSSNFPLSSITYCIHGWDFQQKKEQCGRDNRSCLGGWLNWFFLFFIFSCCHCVSSFCIFIDKKERQKRGGGWYNSPSIQRVHRYIDTVPTGGLT